MSGPLDGKVAVVTGGGSGIGLAIASRLAADGAAVAVLDLNGDAADAAAASVKADGGEAIGLAVDVTDRAGVEAAVAAVVDSRNRTVLPARASTTAASMRARAPSSHISLQDRP